MDLPSWISRLVPPSAKDSYIASLEARIAFYEELFREVTNSHLQGLNMPGVGRHEKTELPKLRGKLLGSQYRRAAEAQDQKNAELARIEREENHGNTQN
jgi:hypothetical protein